MTPLLLSLFGGINITYAFISFYIYYNNKKQLTYFYFSVFSIFSGLYFILNAFSGFFHTDITWIILTCAAIYYGIFPWFLFSYIDKKINNYIKLISIIFTVAIITFFIRPDSNQFALWQIIAHLGVLGTMITTIYTSIFLIKKNE